MVVLGLYFGMKQRIVIVTGGTSGIGLEAVRLFHAGGDIVYSLSRASGVDVSDEESVKEAINKIAEKHGCIDVLVNNAGYGMSGITELVSTEEAKKLIDVNLFGTHFVTKHALPFMHGGAKIINVSSVAGIFPVPYRSFYAASKAAVTAYSLALRGELKPLGIKVCVVSPGNTQTGFTDNRQKSFETNSRYGNRMQNATERLDKKNRMPARVVGKKIYKISRMRKLPPQTIVGRGMRAFYFVSRFLSQKSVRTMVDKTTM